MFRPAWILASLLLVSTLAKGQLMTDTVPYCCDFENAAERAYWRLANTATSNSNKWIINQAVQNGPGQYSLYISNDNVSNNYSNVLSNSYAYRKLYFPAGGIYEASYDWMSQGYVVGAASYAYLRVFLIPAATATFAGGSQMAGLSLTSLPTGAIALDGGAGLNNNSSWQNHVSPLVVVPAAGEYYLVFYWYNSSSQVTQPPAAIDNICVLPVSCPEPINILHRYIGNGCEEISWTSYSNNPNTVYQIEYGLEGFTLGSGVVLSTSHTTDTVCGLRENVTYEFHVRAICDSNDTSRYSSPVYVRRCLQRSTPQCIDYTVLTGPNVTCTYGTYSFYNNYTSSGSGPYANVGIRNPNNGYGGSDIGIGASHAIHSDLSERDSFTFFQLKTIPDGYCESVRLGCRWGGCVCQATAYRMVVDTSIADLILINYAVVLVEPGSGHPPNQKPRFVFEILDTNGNLLDSNCTYANIHAGMASLSWNRGIRLVESTQENQVYWRDWSPIGVDISPYQGQPIVVRITSFHCGQCAQYHAGYIYYTLDCAKARITNNSCASEDRTTTFTAPSGFRYRWYNPSHPGWTSDQQTVTVAVDSSTYYCDVIFTGDTTCKFTLSTMAIPRYPHAGFTVSLDTTNCKYYADITNTSYASTSAQDTVPLGRCEMFYWDFGDGTTSTSENPGRHEYQTAGTYTIMLVAKTADEACADTVYCTVKFNPPVPITLSGDTLVCRNALAHLEVNEPSAVLFQWSNGETTRGIDILITDSITLSVHVTDRLGCEYDLVHHIDMDTVPLPIFEPTVFEACVPFRLRITDINVESLGNTYSWDWGDGFRTINDSTHTHIYRKAGTYPFLCFILSSSGCRDTVGLTAYVYEPPHSAFSWNPAVLSVFDPQITFINLTTPDYDNIYDWEIYYHEQSPVFFPNTFEPTYTWTGDMSEFTGLNLVRLMTTSHIPTHSGNPLTCYDTAEAKVLIVNILLQFPNTVSPNGDGINDIFEIKNLLEGNGYTDNDLYIYNHWGRRVYYKKNISKREDFWDPSLNNDPDGTYYYHFTAKGYLGHVQRNGVIQVVR
jgi:gliding motility-associated-like protein